MENRGLSDPHDSGMDIHFSGLQTAARASDVNIQAASSENLACVLVDGSANSTLSPEETGNSTVDAPEPANFYRPFLGPTATDPTLTWPQENSTQPLELRARHVDRKGSALEGAQQLTSAGNGESKPALFAVEASSGSRLWCSSDASKRLREWSLSNSGPADRAKDLPTSKPKDKMHVDSGILYPSSYALVNDLELWARSRTKSSELYVELGNRITDVVEAYKSLHVDMSPLCDVKDGLRQVLETCLALDAIPEDVEFYLPIIREMLTKIIQVGQPVYYTSQKAYGVKRRNFIIQANSTVTPSGTHVSSREVPLDQPKNMMTICESRNQSGEAHFICIPIIDHMHHSAQSLLRNLEQGGQLRTQVSHSFVQFGDEFNAIMETEALRSSDFDTSNLRSSLEGLRTILQVCLAEDAIPENIKSYLPDVQRMTTKLSQELPEMRKVLNILEVETLGVPSFCQSNSFKSYPGIFFDSPMLHGRHVHLTQGNGRPRVKPHPPTILQTDDVHMTQANQPTGVSLERAPES
ncbi:hypothetical protein ONZ45_g7773 [Pleurotus djamor]|nr:hypothetical protein ONZ45_g7773 [Pleurotus djamor]